MHPKCIPLAVLLVTSCFAYIVVVNGACSEADQANEVQKCEKTFVDTMIKNSSANCTVEVGKIHQCLEKLSKSCYPQVNDKVIKQIVSIGMTQIQALQFYCMETKLNYTWSNVAPSVKNQLSSCAVSFDETANQCSKDFRLKMQKTPKDSAAVYRSYEDSNKCIQRAASKCPTSSGTTKTTTAFWFNATLLLIASIANIIKAY
ncbi:uncharacterized protein LOC116303283 isoform X2 [Actinia tenebrosa]|uniref:Uncharacterized protein LOC116303283 isoform X2 n=1 Tax=Actinia tenebrosa TaxID=6105 RepID=A0A6P8IQF9_ACTTE|nr:uncharacterized protein LOC116303283 isoform X2 [Actinia tenebrosa]